MRSKQINGSEIKDDGTEGARKKLGQNETASSPSPSQPRNPETAKCRPKFGAKFQPSVLPQVTKSTLPPAVAYLHDGETDCGIGTEGCDS
ncbi:unnamed protein product [Bursaphelenchus xylophilus]|uniref:(pine wood nematode) hypothetical protein n=1 Tax=Bursaphelenchus xylophilus TaxID=6326 RepID=A0A1I7S992_BURXY|nr:unnamed protein product [Bursaphelenchus xylophilus]CAG9100451.1 unnamed protein product [Bursaphelenchus xylophilus]